MKKLNLWTVFPHPENQPPIVYEFCGGQHFGVWVSFKFHTADGLSWICIEKFVLAQIHSGKSLRWIVNKTVIKPLEIGHFPATNPLLLRVLWWTAGLYHAGNVRILVCMWDLARLFLHQKQKIPGPSQPPGFNGPFEAPLFARLLHTLYWLSDCSMSDFQTDY